MIQVKSRHVFKIEKIPFDIINNYFSIGVMSKFFDPIVRHISSVGLQLWLGRNFELNLTFNLVYFTNFDI